MVFSRVALWVVDDLCNRYKSLSAQEANRLKLLLRVGLFESSAQFVDAAVNSRPASWLLE